MLKFIYSLVVIYFTFDEFHEILFKLLEIEVLSTFLGRLKLARSTAGWI